MKINQEILSNIAHLARLKIEHSCEETMMNELSKILTWMEKLNEIDTDHIEPLTHISTEINIFKEDEPMPSLDHEKALLNAPKRDANYFRVPKVIE